MSYPNFTAPTPSANELARRADDDTRRCIHRRANELQLKVLDIYEHILGQLANERTSNALALADERRQYANALHAAEFCAKAACRRRHSCQGEPAECLRVLLPAIGLDKAAAHLIARPTRSAVRRRRPSA